MTTAQDLLRVAAEAIDDRASQRDMPNGERSMARAIAGFNGLTGHQLSEEDGWLFMVILKASRSREGRKIDDDYADGSSYFSLMGECALREQETAPPEISDDKRRQW